MSSHGENCRRHRRCNKYTPSATPIPRTPKVQHHTPPRCSTTINEVWTEFLGAPLDPRQGGPFTTFMYTIKTTGTIRSTRTGRVPGFISPSDRGGSQGERRASLVAVSRPRPTTRSAAEDIARHPRAHPSQATQSPVIPSFCAPNNPQTAIRKFPVSRIAGVVGFGYFCRRSNFGARSSGG